MKSYGWVPVDRATLQTKHENMYAIGDATAISIPGRWKPDVPLMLPKAGVFAHAQAEMVARRIAAEITGAGAHDESPGLGYCMLEALAADPIAPIGARLALGGGALRNSGG